MIKILIVEDEEPIANLIRMNLVKAGYQCEIAPDGEEAANIIQERTFDLMLLDIMLPKLNGYEVLEYAKAVDIPVIFLTAMGETQQKVKGLKTTKEYELLLLFLRNKNRALYRETIYESVWGGEYSGRGRTVDLHVQRLKKKLGLEEHIAAIYKVGYRLVV